MRFLLIFLTLFSSCSFLKKKSNVYDEEVIKISKYFSVSGDEVVMLKKRVISGIDIVKILLLSKMTNLSLSQILEEKNKKSFEEVLIDKGIDVDDFNSLSKKIYLDIFSE
ncbi:MAG: hypothetical protein DRI22_03420 [Caldiserica bacterium]|nr:MAG: hypothetical protein DRI22_03420 [Caldisericota bacterium]